MNLYGFASGDPVNFTDPFGLCPPCYPGTPAGNGYLSAVGVQSGGSLMGGLALMGGITVGTVGALAAPQLMAALGARLMMAAPVAAAGVSAKDAIARGLVSAGGNLAALLPEMESQLAKLNPQNANEALGAIAKATQSVGLEVGKISPLVDGGFSIASRGGVLTTIGTNGSVIVERGKDVLLNIPK